MAIADGAPSGEIARARGGFYRNAQDTPYVTDPSGATVKSGPRKGQPKRLPYGSPSGAGKLIENSKALEKWGERRVVLGIGTDLALIADCAALARLDTDSDEFKEAADRIVMRAKDAAEANLAADRGNMVHALTELPDWLGVLERGEAETALGVQLGLDADVQRSIFDSWTEMLERMGLEILATEASCVDDTWCLAGTLDHIARCTKTLTFVNNDGEVLTIPAGSIVLLDKKTGKMRLEGRSVQPLYWHGYVIQVASYAQSKPYDTETETRGEWPWSIDQTHALIAHIDILGALDGNPSCKLVYVDLVAGREHGGATVLAAKAWNARSDLLSVQQLDDADGITDVAGDAGDREAPDADLSVTSSPAATIAASTASAAVEGERSDDDAPTSSSDTIDPPAEVPASLGPADEPRRALAWLSDPKAERHVPDEGDDLGDDSYASSWSILKGEFDRLTEPQRQWTTRLIREANTARVEFQAGITKTARRFEIYRAVLAIVSKVGIPDGGTDEYTRALVSAAMGSDEPRQEVLPLGACIGALSCAEALLFAELATADNVVFGLDDGQRLAVVGLKELATSVA